MSHEHYFKDVSHLDRIDIYRVLDLFGVTNPCIQHAVKKLLCAGQRGAKDTEKDLQEAADSINRALKMIAEDKRPRMVVKRNPIMGHDLLARPCLVCGGNHGELTCPTMLAKAE